MEIFSGTIHQGDPRYFPLNRMGKQCTAISAVACCALLKDGVKHCPWEEIDEWVRLGDKLYDESMKILIEKPKSGYLRPEELACNVPFKKPVTFTVKLVDLVYGSLDGNNDRVGLLPSLLSTFEKYEAAILVCAEYSVALYTSAESEVWMFDSHSRGVDGLRSSDGTAVLIKFVTVEEVLVHLHKLYGEQDRDFELFPIELTDIDQQVPMMIHENQAIQQSYKDFETECNLNDKILAMNLGYGPEYLLGYPMPQWMITDLQSRSIDEPPRTIASYSSVVACTETEWTEWRNQPCRSPTSSEVSFPMSMASDVALDVADEEVGCNNAREVSAGDEVPMENAVSERVDDDAGEWRQQRHQVRGAKRRAQQQERRAAHQAESPSAPPSKRRLSKKEKERLKRQKTRESVKRLRQDEAYRKAEAEKNAKRMAETRIILTSYVSEERTSNRKRMRLKRQKDEKYVQRESEANRERMARLRQEDEVYAERESEANRERITRIRQEDEEYAERESQANRERITRIRQEDEQYARKEIHLNSQRIAEIRQTDQLFRARERRSNVRRIRNYRLEEEFRDQERVSNAYRRSNSELYLTQKAKFMELIKEGPTHICSCCGQLWFRKSVLIGDSKYFNAKKIMSNWMNICKCWHPDGNTYSLCSTCQKYLIGKKQVPPLALINGLEFPDIPEELRNLTELEERLISPRLLFMRIRALGVDRQVGLQGNCVNVPVDINNSVSALPRQVEDTHTVFVEIMRRMRDQRPYVLDAVRPNVVFRAAKYLSEQPLYQKHNIALDEGWLQQFMQLVQDTEQDAGMLEEADERANEEREAVPLPQQDDEWDERTEEERLFDDQETLLDDVHLPDPSRGIRIAPGENQIPLSVLFDEDVEELSFPSIYCGQGRALTRKLTMAQIAKAEARMYDRRCATRIPKMFLTFCRLRRRKLADKISLAIRKKRVRRGLTVREVLDPGCMNDMVQHNEGYRVLQVDRASPAFWEGKKKTLFAMVRQFGVPTLFLTFSCAEQRWPPLLVILKQTVDNKTITEEEAMELSREEKYSLVRSDPYTVARYCNERFHHMWRLFQSKGGPLHPYRVEHYYVRLEFQHRGSVHFHMIVWLEGAPVYDPTDPHSEQRCVQFVDELITCKLDEELGDVINVQFHRHSPSCHKQLWGQRVCRFGVPFAPMRKTCILHPLDPSQVTDNEKTELRRKYAALQTRFATLLKNTSLLNSSFDEFLALIGLDEEEYVKVLRAQLQRAKLFLRRDFSAGKLNAYNNEMLVVNNGNMDIQFILDPYGLGVYVVNYINKPLRGIAKTIKETADAVREGNTGVAEQLRAISNVFINKSEVCSQEVAFHNLSIPLSLCSEAEVFINTSPAEERTRLLKSQRELQDMLAQDPECGNVFAVGLLEHYVQRPDELEECCLADFAAWYEYSRSRRGAQRAPRHQADDPDDLDEDAGNDNEEHLESEEVSSPVNVYALKDKSGFVRKRTKCKVIRYRNYSAAKDLNNFVREQLMLFTSWRNEEYVSTNINAVYVSLANVVKENRSKYVKVDVDFEEILEQVARDNPEEEAENTEECEIHPDFAIYEAEEGVAVDIAQDVGPDCGTVNAPQSERFLLPRMDPQEEYLANVAKLNDKQRRFHDNFVHVLKTDPKRQMLYFVNGGAGVGKSMLIRVLTQSVMRVHVQLGGHPDEMSTALATPTGRSAFLIGAVTIHSGLHIFSQNQDMNLGADVLNTLRCELLHVRLLILDEISMVGRRLFDTINKRLQQIFSSQEVLGGISVVVFGDFNQLRPVLDQWIFQSPRDDLSLLAGPYVWRRFQFYELTEIMRQRDDATFAEALNRLAVGRTTAEDDLLFASREVAALRSCGVEVPEDAVHLLERNEDVHNFNTAYLNSLRTESCESCAMDYCEGTGTEASKQRQLERVRTLPLKDTQNLPQLLIGKVSARYMVTVNINTKDGLTNGAAGTLRRIVWGRTAGGARVPLRLYLQFEDETIGRQTRTDHRDVMHRDGAESSWTPLERVSRAIVPSKGALFKVVRKQFPLTPAKATTIHKTQGSTNRCVVVHMRNTASGRGQRAMERRAMYVACSRVTSIEGLFIDGKYQRPLPPVPGDSVAGELARLRLPENKLSFTLQFPELSVRPRSVVALFHNIRSLHKHRNHILRNSSYTAADMIMLCETWTKPEDDIEWPGYTIMHRRDCVDGRRHAYGTVLYVRDSLTAAVKILFNADSLKVYKKRSLYAFVDIVTFEININCSPASVTFLHKSPKCSKTMFEEHLSKAFEFVSENNILKDIIVGDFNTNIHDEVERRKLDELMASRGLTLRIDEKSRSTDYGTLIDLCYSNVAEVQGIMFESVISDHKPVWFHIACQEDG